MEGIIDGPEEECASGWDFITHFPMGVNVLGGIYMYLSYTL